MTFDDFVARVQSRAHMSSAAEAQQAIRAILEVLSQRLTAANAAILAAGLPAEMAPYFARTGPDPRLDLAEFLERVSLRAGCDLPDAIHHVRALAAVLCEALDAQSINAMHANFSGGFEALFECPDAARAGRHHR
jgi:uncharacterized protein (DUF2267 family)